MVVSDDQPNIIDVKFKLLRELLLALTEYFGIASDIMIRVDPSTHDRFAKQIVELGALIESTEKMFKTAKTLADHLKAASGLELIVNGLYAIAGVLGTPFYEEKVTMTKSVGFQTQIREKLARIVNIIDAYKSRVAKDDETEIRETVKSLGLSDKAARESAIDAILLTTTPSRLIVEVIKATIRADPKTVTKLAPVIERLKSSALGGHADVAGTLTNTNIEQWLTCELSIIPASQYMSIKELCADINVKYTFDDTADAHSNLLACIDSTISLLFIPRSADREVDYCVLGLIDDYYIAKHSLHTNQSAGLNKRIVKRFSSLRDVLSTATTAGSTPRFTMRGPACAVVMELGSEYRVMGALGTNGVGSILVTDYVTRLLKPLSARPTNYHNIQSDYILSIGEALEHRTLIRWYEESRMSANPQTDAFKSELVKKLSDAISIDPARHNNPHEFAELCRKSYQQGLVAETMKFLGERNLGGREKRSTFTVRMSGLIAAYATALEPVLAAKLTPNQFTERGDIERHLRGLYADVTRATVDALDVPPSKFQQLGITLKEHFLKTRGGMAT